MQKRKRPVTVVEPEARFQQLLNWYEVFVEEVERGYFLTIYNYTNELGVRQLMREVCEKGFSPAEEARVMLDQLDTRFKRMLIPAKKPLYPGYDKSHFWYHQVPRNAQWELLEDLLNEGIL